MMQSRELDKDGERGPSQSQEGPAIPRFAGIRTFGRLPPVDDASPPAVAVLGAPFDGGTTFRPGARFGPTAIREASMLLRPYYEPLGVAPFAAISVADAGDAPASPMDIEVAHEAIESAARELAALGARVIALGGDHSVSLPLLRAAAARHGRLSLLHLDAHMDTSDVTFGSRVTHGTVFRRAVEEHLIDPGTSLQIGMRGSLFRASDAAENLGLGFRMLRAHDLDSCGVSGAVALARETLRGPVYLTVDIDVLDPAFAPGTGVPEPGGLTSRELFSLLQGMPSSGVQVVSGDVVEVCPPYDLAGITAIAAANVVYALIAILAGTPRAKSP